MSDAIGADELGRLRSSLLVLARRLRNTTLGNELSATSFSVLVRVHRDGPQTPGSLARAEHVQPPSMTKIVEALEISGYLSRESHPQDGRRQVISATAAGVAYIEQTREQRNSWLLGRIEQLGDSERAALVAAAPVLQRLAELP